MQVNACYAVLAWCAWCAAGERARPKSSIHSFRKNNTHQFERSEDPRRQAAQTHWQGWVKGSWGSFPSHPVVAGWERGRRLFVARSDKGARYIGTLREGDICVRFPLNAAVVCYTAYEILNGLEYYWTENLGLNSNLHPDYLIAGWTWVSSGVLQSPMAVCRGVHKKLVYVGRVYTAENAGCIIPMENPANVNDQDFTINAYDILLAAIK